MLNFSVSTTPEFPPNICRNCGGFQNREWWLDFNYQEEFYGHVYFCNVCVDQMCRKVGYVPTREIEAVIKAHEAKLDEVTSQEVYVSIYNRMFGSSLNPYDLLRILDEQESSRVHKVVAETVARREERSLKSGNVGRSSDVPSPAIKFSLGLGSPERGDDVSDG